MEISFYFYLSEFSARVAYCATRQNGWGDFDSKGYLHSAMPRLRQAHHLKRVIVLRYPRYKIGLNRVLVSWTFIEYVKSSIILIVWTPS